MTTSHSEPAERARLRRRRLLLGWSAPVVLAALVAGCLLLGTAFGNLLGRQDYDALRYPQAATQFEAQQEWTGFAEPWKAWFNSGTAQYRAEEYFRAVEDLRVALVAVPVAEPLEGAPADTKDPQAPECRVRTNLSVAVEAMGDEAAAVADHGMAAVHYAEAQEIIDPCTAMQENEDSSDRQQDKEDQAREDEQDPTEEPSEDPTDEPGDEPTEDPTDDPTQDPTEDPEADPTEDPSDEPGDDSGEEPSAEPEPTDDPRREELEERNRDAEQERQEDQQRGGGGSGGGQNW